MMGKAEQDQVRVLLKEAIKVLCRNGLQYKAGFVVEGLLGITRLDDDHVFLININETVVEENKGEKQNHTIEKNRSKSTGGRTKSHPVHPVPPVVEFYGSSSASPASEVQDNVAPEYPREDYYEIQGMLKRKKCDNQILESSKKKRIIEIKEEVVSDGEDQSRNGGWLPLQGRGPDYEAALSRNAVWNPSSDIGNLTGLTESPQMSFCSPYRLQGDPQEDADEQIPADFEPRMQFAIMKSPGCIVMSRPICRKLTAKSEVVTKAMKALTVPQGHPMHVGEYRRISSTQHIFFKCPPELLQPGALDRFRGMDPENYASLYFTDPRPEKGGPLNWEQYLEGIIRNYPYDPFVFPLMSMGLGDVQMERLTEYAHQVSVVRQDFRLETVAARESAQANPETSHSLKNIARTIKNDNFFAEILKSSIDNPNQGILDNTLGKKKPGMQQRHQNKKYSDITSCDQSIAGSSAPVLYREADEYSKSFEVPSTHTDLDYNIDGRAKKDLNHSSGVKKNSSICDTDSDRTNSSTPGNHPTSREGAESFNLNVDPSQDGAFHQDGSDSTAHSNDAQHSPRSESGVTDHVANSIRSLAEMSNRFNT